MNLKLRDVFICTVVISRVMRLTLDTAFVVGVLIGLYTGGKTV